MEKPVRRKGSKGSFLRSLEAGSTSTHDHAANLAQKQQSRSANVNHTRTKDDIEEAYQPPSKRSSATHSRTYHIPATSAQSDTAALETRNAIIMGEKRIVDPSVSGDVDLNLSFDFVSNMEGGDNSMASSIDGIIASSSVNHDRALDIRQAKESPRGMSKADWGSRSRKNPPTPLSLSKRRAEMNAEQQSHFSPDSPTTGAMRLGEDDEPLTLIPLSSTKRAVDSAITPLPTQQGQRDASATATQRTHKKTRSSPVKRNAQGAVIVNTSPVKRKGGSLRSGKVPFGENKGLQNAQLERKETADDIIFVSAKEGVEKRDSNASMLTTAHASSLGHDSASLGHRFRPGRSRQTSVQESADSNHSAPLSFKTSATSKTSTNDHGQASSSNYHSVAADLAQSAGSPSAENVLGLFFPAQHAPAVPRIQAPMAPTPPMPSLPIPPVVDSQGLSVDTVSSPLSTVKSSPETPYTPLFADQKRGSIASSGPRTPATAVSALFHDHNEERKAYGQTLSVDSAPMSRGLTAPVPPPSSIAAQVIREESILSIERPSSVPPMNSSASQAEVSRELFLQHEVQSSNDHSTESSDISSAEGVRVLQKMIVSTVSSPGKSSFDLTHITGTSIKKGPWNESPLLLEEEDQDGLKGIGLGLMLRKPTLEQGPSLSDSNTGKETHWTNNTDMIVQRAEVPFAGGLNALGIDLGSQGMEVNKAGMPSAPAAQALQPPQRIEEKKLTNLKKSASQVSAGTDSSSVDGFAINVTPPAPVAHLEEEIYRADHRLDMQNCETPKASARTTEIEDGRNRWSMKMWNVANAFRSPIRGSNGSVVGAQETTSPSQMRTLTLVDKQISEPNKTTLAGGKHRRGRSQTEGIAEAARGASPANEQRDTNISAPSTTSATDAGRFEQPSAELARPQAALYGDTRNSRQTLRPTSGIRYLTQKDNEGGHVRVEMEVSDGVGAPSRAFLDDIRSPRVAPSPSGMTPRMEFLSNSKNNRHSWTSNNDHTSQHGAPTVAGVSVSPWLAPKRQSYVGAQDSELYNLAANAQSLLNGGGNVDEDVAHVEQILGDEGLRRRMNHRSINSVPNTPIFVPQNWTDAQEEHVNVPHHEVANLVEPVRQVATVAFDEASTGGHASKQAAVRRNEDGRRSRMSVYARPLSGLYSLFNNPASNWRSEPNAELQSTAEREREMHQQFFRSTSMPYLHLHVRRHSTMPIGASRASRRLSQAVRQQEGEQQGFLAMSGRALQESTPSQTLFFAGFFCMPWLWFIGGWALDNDGLMYIEHEPAYGRMPSQRLHHPYGNGGVEPGFEVTYGRSSDIGIHTADDSLPSGLSHRTYASARANVQDHDSPYLNNNDLSLDQHTFRDRQQRQRSDARLWQRISQANMAIWHATSTGLSRGMGGAQQRKQQADKAARSSQDDSNAVQWARSTFDWRGLDSYVVANRIMAMIAFVLVFGGMIAAVVAVALHWH